jgi:hypothetical protein
VNGALFKRSTREIFEHLNFSVDEGGNVSRLAQRGYVLGFFCYSIAFLSLGSQEWLSFRM